MRIYLAMSALQGRPAVEALRELVPLARESGCEGIQLTPGNSPPKDRELPLQGLKSRFHHTYSPTSPIGKGWHRQDGALAFGTVTDNRSIHPPFGREATIKEACDYFSKSSMLCEIPLYKQYLGASYSDCMALAEACPSGVAVDVSHLFISLTSEGWTVAQVREVMNLPNIREIHVSANNGRIDQHRSLFPTDFGLDWARERAQDNIPVVLECYMHTLDSETRRKQFFIVRGKYD